VIAMAVGENVGEGTNEHMETEMDVKINMNMNMKEVSTSSDVVDVHDDVHDDNDKDDGAVQVQVQEVVKQKQVDQVEVKDEERKIQVQVVDTYQHNTTGNSTSTEVGLGHIIANGETRRKENDPNPYPDQAPLMQQHQHQHQSLLSSSSPLNSDQYINKSSNKDQDTTTENEPSKQQQQQQQPLQPQQQQQKQQDTIVPTISSESTSKDILAIVQTQSDTPILLFHPEQESQLTSCDDDDDNDNDNGDEDEDENEAMDKVKVEADQNENENDEEFEKDYDNNNNDDHDHDDGKENKKDTNACIHVDNDNDNDIDHNNNNNDNGSDSSSDGPFPFDETTQGNRQPQPQPYPSNSEKSVAYGANANANINEKHENENDEATKTLRHKTEQKQSQQQQSDSPKRQRSKQDSSSALDNLVRAASKPSFHRMESDTKLVDPETPPSKIDKSNAKTHDLDLDFASSDGGDSDDDDGEYDDESGDGDGDNRHNKKLEFSQTKKKSGDQISNAKMAAAKTSDRQHQHRKLNNSSNHSSSSNSVSSASLSSQRYKIKNRDTGKTYDIRDLEVVKSDDDEEILQVKYTLFPSKYDLMELHNKRSSSGGGGDDDDADFVNDEDDSDETGLFSPMKDTRIAISKSRKAVVSRTTRAVAKASKTISKGFMSGRSKSEGSPVSSESPFGTLLEPFPFNETDENSPVRPINAENVSPKKDDDASVAAQSIAPGASNDSGISSSSKAVARNNQNQKSDQQKQKKKRNGKAPLLTIPKNTLPVKCVNKSRAASDFNPLLLISTFAKAHNGPIWRSSFSKDGKYLATGGADGVLNIWQIAPSRKQIKASNKKESECEADSIWKGDWGEETDDENDNRTLPTVKSECDAIGTEVKFMLSEPVQSFKEHTNDIVDISWSNTGFLLSGSLDKTVRLWHPTRPTSLHLFRHPDAVTCVSFHPKEDRYFLSGGFDKRIRIWNITNGRVVEWAQASHIITTARYQPDGTRVAAGLIDGKVIFYSVDGIKLKFFTEILCKNRSKRDGKKVTGIAYKNLQNLIDDEVDKPKSKTKVDSPEQKKTKLKTAAKMVKSFTTQRKKKKIEEQILITSNDSRLRLVGLNDLCMVRKYKGHANPTLQFKARFSESGEFIIIGSETGKCVIWNTATRRNPLNVNVTGLHMYDKVKGFECFEATRANPPIVTEATFAPSVSAKDALLNSGLFPSMKKLGHINHDFSSAFIVTCDYEGTIRVFLRQVSFQAVIHAAGPMGDTESAKSPFARSKKKKSVK